MRKINQEYLGFAGQTGFDRNLTEKYNILLEYIGAHGMLEQFERFIDESELSDIINQIEDNLQENDIKLPYKN